MTFDALVSQLEERLLPGLREEATAVRACGQYRDVSVFSLRHIDTVHSIGINCHPNCTSGKLECLSLSATLIGAHWLTASANIIWNDAVDTRTLSGHFVCECRPIQLRIVGENDVARFVDRWNRMVKNFERIARRGKPNSRLLRWWRGAPADCYQRLG